MSRDINDPKVKNVVAALDIWLAEDGEMFDPIAVRAMLETADLEQCRAPVVRAVFMTLLRECSDVTLAKLDRQATLEHAEHQRLALEAQAHAALMKLGADAETARRLIYEAVGPRCKTSAQAAELGGAP